MFKKFLSLSISSLGSYLLCLAQTVNAANAELSFECYKRVYEVGEYVILDLQENLQVPSRFHRVDLWVAVQLPDGGFLFKTLYAFAPFSVDPQPFRESLETTTRRHRVLEFEVVAGLGGDYTFYALYVEEGKNAITEGFPVYRSNIATATTSLSNRISPDSNIPSREETPCYNSSSPETPPSDENQPEENQPPPTPQPGDVFRDTLADGNLGPEMVVIPAGTFQMGDIQGVGSDREKPVHWVSIGSFAMGRYEITNAEYVHFLNSVKRRGPAGEPWFNTKDENEDSHIIGTPGNFGVETGYENHPVIEVSWYGVTAYADWLSQQTGKSYRLPSEAQWEYAARAGTDTQYWWGNEIGTDRANCHNYYCGDSFDRTAPVGSFAPNPFGLYDTVGNVWEWVADPWHDNYEGAPTDGSVWTEGGSGLFVLRGGSWFNVAWRTRAASRYGNEPANRGGSVGVRLARQ
jgi:formylglycine-generating enzyme required for sulfatase activity